MERCPRCGGQLISCGCRTEDLPDFRIPWVQIPFLCGLCGERFPALFSVPDEDWEMFVVPELQKEVLCKTCYDRLVKLFPYGWKIGR